MNTRHDTENAPQNDWHDVTDADGFDDDFDAVKVFDELQAEIIDLKESIAYLTATDTGKVIYDLKCMLANQTSERWKVTKRLTTVLWYEKLIKDIAKELDTHDYKKLLPKVKALKARAQNG